MSGSLNRCGLSCSLLDPVLRSAMMTRMVQISGGNKYLPPRQDVNAPDLYIPLCALFSYVVMAAMVAVGHKRFSPNSLYSSVSPMLKAHSSLTSGLAACCSGCPSTASQHLHAILADRLERQC